MKTKRKKRVLHIITGLQVGGAETMLQKTLPKMQDSFDNHVCTLLQDGPVGKKLREAGIKTCHLNFSPLNPIASILAFRKIIRSFEPDILVTYLIHADLFGRVFGRLFGIKTIISSQRGKLLQWEFLRAIDRMTSFLITRYVAQTEIAKQELMIRLHLPGEKFIVIPNGIDMKEFEFEVNKEQERQKLNLSPTDTVLVCVSNLRQGKGIEYLLEAFESLNNKNLRLLIVGDGAEMPKLLAQTNDYQSKSSIYFLGHRNDIKKLLKVSDIFILPTLGEGMSNAILEAMACGMPIITTDIPENRALLTQEKTALLVSPRSSKGLEHAITKIMNDAHMRSTLGDNAKRVVEDYFSLDLVVSQWKTHLSAY